MNLFKQILFFSCMLITIQLYGNNSGKWKHTQEKTIEKSFKVNENATLDIDNRYGNVKINSWDKDYIEIKVIVSVQGNDEDLVLEKLNQIKIDFSDTSSYVRAKTNYNDQNSKRWWNWGNSSKKVQKEVHYYINMPVTNHLVVDNDYGNIHIDRLEGSTKLDCDYGKIIAGELHHESNQINIDYNSHCDFGFINKAQIDADYSDFYIEKANQIDLNADYTKSEFNQIDKLNYNCDYGSLKIGTIQTLKGQSDYMSIRLNTLMSSATLDGDYGSIRIKNLAATVQKVDIETSYAGVNIAFDSNLDFHCDLQTRYGSINVTEGMEFSKKKIYKFSKEYSGSFGENFENCLIRIETSYAGITLKRF